MRRISCDHLRLRKYLGQSYDGCITKIHLRVLGRERTQVGHVFRQKIHHPKSSGVYEAVKLIHSRARPGQLPRSLGDN